MEWKWRHSVRGSLRNNVGSVWESDNSIGQSDNEHANGDYSSGSANSVTPCVHRIFCVVCSVIQTALDR